MSYTPNTWKSGDVVTSAKLNNMEQGIAAAGALMVQDTYDPDEETHTLGTKGGELYAACQNSPLVFVLWSMVDDPGVTDFSVCRLIEYAHDPAQGYLFVFDSGFDTFSVVAPTADDYPSTPHGD